MPALQWDGFAAVLNERFKCNRGALSSSLSIPVPRHIILPYPFLLDEFTVELRKWVWTLFLSFTSRS